jgi:acyl dehydratase
MAKVEAQPMSLDTTDVDRHVGKPVGGGQLKDPVSTTDIRRWVQGMQYPNPLHYDDAFAARTAFGGIVAPQSFTVCCEVGHGAGPAIVGNLPGTHMIFGGDEWWFSTIRIFPGDHLRMERRFHDYKVANTKFAGPTMFSRGDTVYRNDRGEYVAKQRSTAVRYLAEEARRLGFFERTAPSPTWTPEQLAAVEETRLDWVRSNRAGDSPAFPDVAVGTRLPRRAIGPHTVQSFTTEWRAYIFTAWGSSYHEGPEHLQEAGWLPEMERNLEAGELDPALTDGLYRGPSRGHTDEEHARLIGMPRGYGYGASMGAWVLDYAGYWAGHRGFVRHSNVQYRFPAFTGDVTYLDAEVVATREDETVGAGIVTLDVVMSTQDGSVMAKGPVEVQLPG